MLKKLATVAATAALIVGLPAAAHADPKNADNLTLNCDNGEAYDIHVFSNGFWSPGLLADGNGVVRAVALEVNGTVTPAGGEPETFTESGSKPVPPNAETTDCTFVDFFSDEFVTVDVRGSVTIVLPRR